MKILCEVTQERDEQGDNGETLYTRGKYWLMHFGLEFKMIETDQGLVPVNYTVAICENYETGQVETYQPSQIKILGKQIKE